MGLDPPRHLVLFNPQSLVLAATRGGILEPRCSTSAGNTSAFARLSLGERRSQAAAGRQVSALRARLLATLVQYLASAARVVAPSSGDECVLQAVK